MTATNLEAGSARLIGTTIRDARLALKLSKTDAALKARISRRTWHEIEAGTRTSSTAETLAAIDRALGFRPGTLFAMTAQAADAETESLLAEAIEIVRRMSGDRAELEAFVRSEGRETVHARLDAMERQLAALVARSDPATRAS
jgi:transcriptional regulator with XRE-family HTH domain